MSLLPGEGDGDELIEVEGETDVEGESELEGELDREDEREDEIELDIEEETEPVLFVIKGATCEPKVNDGSLLAEKLNAPRGCLPADTVFKYAFFAFVVVHQVELPPIANPIPIAVRGIWVSSVPVVPIDELPATFTAVWYASSIVEICDSVLSPGPS